MLVTIDGYVASMLTPARQLKELTKQVQQLRSAVGARPSLNASEEMSSTSVELQEDIRNPIAGQSPGQNPRNAIGGINSLLDGIRDQEDHFPAYLSPPQILPGTAMAPPTPYHLAVVGRSLEDVYLSKEQISDIFHMSVGDSSSSNSAKFLQFLQALSSFLRHP